MLSLAAWLHTLDPYAIKLWEGGPVRWYGLSYIAGFGLAYLLIRWVVRSGRSTLQAREVADLVVAVALGAVIGGRLGYVLIYQPALLGPVPGFPWWGVVAINEGGMSSHGGMIGAVLGGLYFARANRHPWGHVMDLAAFATPAGLFLGRLANFVNGELYGRACSPEFPLGVQFPQEMAHWPRDRWVAFCKLAEIATDTPISTVLERIERGSVLLRQAAAQTVTPRHPSQLYEAVAEGLVLGLVLLLVWRKPRKPWVVGSWFLIVYAVLRIACEFFREPDFHLQGQEYGHWGITRGQLLSAGILLAGLVILGLAQRGKAAPLGGWRQHRPTAGPGSPPAPSGTPPAGPAVRP